MITVGELKEILNEIPEGMSMEDFDKIPVLVYDEFGELVDACECETGINLVDVLGTDEQEIVFSVLPHDYDIDQEEIDNFAQLN